MNKIVCAIIVMFAVSAYSYAEELTSADFKLIPQDNITTQATNTTLDDVLKELQELKKEINNTKNKDVKFRTEEEYDKLIKTVPTPAPVVVQPKPTNPEWSYDPTTHSYFRYVPTTQVTRATIVQYPRATPTPTAAPVYNYQPAPVMSMPMSRPMPMMMGGGGGGAVCVGGG